MSKNCQKCGAEMADNMNFCPKCHAKYEVSAAGGKSPTSAAGCSPAEADKILQYLLQRLTNQQYKYSAVKTGENRYGLKLENPLVNAAADIIIDGRAGSFSARLDNIKTSPTPTGWVCLILAFYLMIPVYFLFLAPLMKKCLNSVMHGLNAAIHHPHAFLLPDQPGFNANGKNAEEIVRLCFGSSQVPHDTRICFAGGLDMSLVNSAIANYAQGVAADKIICVIDTTPPGLPAGSCGVVFTLDKIYFRYCVIKITVSNRLGYQQISGGLLMNCSITGPAFKYQAVLAASDPRNNALWGIFPGMSSGGIPEPVLCFQEKLLYLVRAMQARN